LNGDSNYIDVLERSLYNGVIAGVALDGKNFFYPNPLECDMHYHFNRGSLEREPWFDCSCCPSNLCRFMPSVPGYIYAQLDNSIYVNLFVESKTDIELENNAVKVEQKNNYPWDGAIQIDVSPKKKSNFSLRVRIPGWSLNQPLPGDLYSYLDNPENKPVLSLNGKTIDYTIEKGYAVLTREWNTGDRINLDLPMDIKKVQANEMVEDDLGKVSLERGPIVYCVEEVDNPQIDDVKISEHTNFTSEFRADLLAGVEVVKGSGDSKSEQFSAVPYYVWNNRGANKMKVWLYLE